MDRYAIFATSPKGGPGKSTFARAILDYYRSRGVLTAAYDGDDKNQGLSQFYATRRPDGSRDPIQDPLKGVKLFAGRKIQDRDLLMNLLDTKAERAVIDLRGGGEDDVTEVVGNADRFFQAYQDEGIQPIVVILINHLKATAAGAGAIIRQFGPRPHYVVCKNLAFAASDDFIIFDGLMQDGERLFGRGRELLASVNGTVIEMPALHPLTYAKLDAWDIPFDEAYGHPRLQRSDRIRVDDWRKQFAANIRDTILAAPDRVSVLAS